jgi:hypothetical protein
MADTTNKELLEQLENMAKSMESIKTDIEPIGLATGLVTKLIQAIVGNVIKTVKTFDAIRISNADLNVNFTKMQQTIKDQGVDIGTMTEHTQMQLNLHRIGYKQINKDLREQLVWLDKTDKQGADLVKFMSTLVEKGADIRTQTLIAEEIADVARSTGQSARAAISAADQMGDQITVLKALGLDDDMLMTVLKAAEEMPQTNAASLGKFVAEMIEPKDITKSILLGTYQSGRDLLRENATVQERVAIIQRGAAEASERAQGFLKQAGPDPFLLKTFKDTFVGSTGILAMQVNAANILKSSVGEFGTDVDKYSDTTDAYQGSFEQLGDSVQQIADGFALELLPQLIGDTGLLGKLDSIIPDLGTAAKGMAAVVDFVTGAVKFFERDKDITITKSDALGNTWQETISKKDLGAMRQKKLDEEMESRARKNILGEDFVIRIKGKDKKDYSEIAAAIAAGTETKDQLADYLTMVRGGAPKHTMEEGTWSGTSMTGAMNEQFLFKLDTFLENQDRINGYFQAALKRGPKDDNSIERGQVR